VLEVVFMGELGAACSREGKRLRLASSSRTSISPRCLGYSAFDPFLLFSVECKSRANPPRMFLACARGRGLELGRLHVRRSVNFASMPRMFCRRSVLIILQSDLSMFAGAWWLPHLVCGIDGSEMGPKFFPRQAVPGGRNLPTIQGCMHKWCTQPRKMPFNDDQFDEGSDRLTQNCSAK
jgi:hypothetical protein